MPKLLQINVTSNWGSTGKIAEECNRFARSKGWETYCVYGRYSNPSDSVVIAGPSSKLDIYEHYVENIFLDREGLASRLATRKLLRKIADLKPDIIHLHNIHDHWLNYEILFKYLNKTDIHIVWTFHDYWAVTGHCSHFVQAECDKFKSECCNCPYIYGHCLPFLDRSNKNFILKKQLFSANKNLIIVPVSEWVEANVRESFLKSKDIRLITNGVDVEVFKPRSTQSNNLKFEGKFVILAVASQWTSGSKGLDDYKAMSYMLRDDEVIVLVGVPNHISRDFPENIIGISRTNNQLELAELYTRADVICSFSSAETFGLTIVEGYACGTPAVVYNNTALPALIIPETGIVVPNNDYQAAYQAIQEIRAKGKTAFSDACIALAHNKYSKDRCFGEYIKLYESLLGKSI